MGLYVGKEKFRRNRETDHIFSDFLVPIYASYACGENELNTYVEANHSIEDEGPVVAYYFEGIQVRFYNFNYFMF